MSENQGKTGLIRLSKAYVDHKETDAIRAIFEGPVHFGLGQEVFSFEKELQDFVGSNRTAVCVNTGTSALHIAVGALGFPPGSEIIIPSITFVASFQAVSLAGLVPVACDVAMPGVRLDPEDVRRKLTSRTVAIMPVSYTGVDFDRDAIYAIAAQHKLRVIEDNAHAFGSRFPSGKMAGADGDISCFSFDGIKNVTCGEGGAVFTSDPEFAAKIRTLRSLGIENESDLRNRGTRAWQYDVKEQGFRYHMSNINAAVGRVQLAKIKTTHTKKSAIFKAYCELLKSSGLERKIRRTQEYNEKINYHIFPCMLDKAHSRDKFRELMREQGIETGIHYVPNHLHTKYKSKGPLPNANEFGETTVSLPLHPGLTQNDIERVIATAAKILA
jgi:dTDP-4-amino-4,6-dideoxygalactose transaminase